MESHLIRANAQNPSQVSTLE
nr:unnamed protein product [Callosobruchus chinensis]